MFARTYAYARKLVDLTACVVPARVPVFPVLRHRTFVETIINQEAARLLNFDVCRERLRWGRFRSGISLRA